MEYVKAVAPGKVNLALRVGSPRADGFHPLDTVFEALDVYEECEAWLDHSGLVTLEYDPQGYGENLPVDATNLAIRAALLLKECYGVSLGARMRILKRIPIAGGMAGGSADAAAALVALAALWNIPVSTQTLARSLGAQLGSDVPFVMLGGMAHGIDRGENLMPIESAERHGFVMLVNPRGLSTPLVFGEFDRLAAAAPPEQAPQRTPASTDGLCRVLAGGGVPLLDSSKDASESSCVGATRSLSSLASLLANDLEPPAFSLRPDLQQITQEIRLHQQESSSWGDAVILSGSGPTLAVLCKPNALPSVAECLRTAFPELTAITACGPAQGAHVVECA